jgi:hypothetical protein
MKSMSPRAALTAAALLVLASFGSAGCAGKDITGTLVPNQRPSVELTQAPVAKDFDNPYFYAYKVNWSGNDPDGRVAYYLYAIDPPSQVLADTSKCNNGDTCWVRTERNEEILFFRATQPDPPKSTSPPTASDAHVFVIKAVDDDGMESPHKSRAFYSYTIAPTVAIRNPVPSPFLRAQVTPSVRIEWEGSDVDGQFSQKPVKYKYTMLDLGLTSVQYFLSDPDSLRRREAASNWAGWDSTSADTQFVQFTNLTPSNSYLFVLIGFDEAGAYSPIFNLNSNMLQLTAGFASSNGPRIHMYNEYIDYTYDSGGYTTDPLREVNIEVPTGVRVNVNWDAIASPGSRIQHFRWMVNGNINDETRRNDEVNDYQYWSREDPTMPNGVSLRPFADGEHRFYIECADNNGQKSLGILKLTAVTPSFDKNLIVVNDTRLEVNKFLNDGSNQRPDIYTKGWPSRCELDTFLFARGGVPWRGTRNPLTGVISPPGVMAGYDFDTLGTRLGLENPARGVLLSRIGQYRNLIWIVDETGAQYIQSLDQQIFPITALYAMSGPGRASTLAAYTQLGGRVWMTGGGAGYASMKNFDRPNNNVGQTTVFSSAVQFGELAPGRIMFDGAHWQSSMGVTKSGMRQFRYQFTINELQGDQEVPVTYIGKKPWSHHNRFTNSVLNSPNYSKLPVEMRPASAIPDPLPPTRLANQANLFYATSFPCEYILSGNFILEDVDPSPEGVTEASVLDTLIEAEGIVLLTTPKPGQTTQRAPSMTYYHGNQANQFVFTGFAPWQSARQDCIAMFDFVLQDLWNLPRAPVDRGTVAPNLQRNGGSKPARSAAPKRLANASVSSGTSRE